METSGNPARSLIFTWPAEDIANTAAALDCGLFNPTVEDFLKLSFFQHCLDSFWILSQNQAHDIYIFATGRELQ